ncbi:TPA: hypothetical protein N5N83_004443 [Enterobacter bugandensis]|uniref:hypothetical protein n=1 Tax=Enterobacter bugandensis TaxID=881260 RepID=UPI0032B01EBA|nr:hypothetical protein [Enterobacter bugandensis]
MNDMHQNFAHTSHLFILSLAQITNAIFTFRAESLNQDNYMRMPTCSIGLVIGLNLSGTLIHAATVFTGDKVQGVPVISALDISDLIAGQHRFMFEGVETGTGNAGMYR